MTRLLTLLSLYACSLAVGAQDLVVTNARIVIGNGDVIERGSIAISDGRIVSVGTANTAKAAIEIDANRMTVMPGYIDAHRHIIDGDPQAWLRDRAKQQMQGFLDAGFTSLLSGGDDTDGIVELRRRLKLGELAGPRLLVSGSPVRVTSNAEEARSEVRALVRANVDVIKSVYNSTPDGAARRTLEAIVDEARRWRIPTMVHAVTVEDTFDAVDVGVSRLVHTPHTGILDEAAARRIAAAGIPMTSTLGVYVPIFGDDNSLRWRDGSPFPDGGIQRAGQGPVNARQLWDAGIVYGFGTDTRFRPKDSLAHELKALQLLFSPADVVRILTVNAAEFMGVDTEVGTLEPGKLADIVIVAGNPLKHVSDLLNVRIVIQGGRIVAKTL